MLLGVARKLDRVAHHTVYFSADYRTGRDKPCPYKHHERPALI
jgi:hypothetical protein